MNQGSTSLVVGKERLHIHHQVLDDRETADRLHRDLGPTSCTSVLQARRLRPLMTMASEPQMPCAQDRRSVSVPS